ncbi:regulator [Wenjunlia vitaminophila]|uniref:Regulator n=1 Tax=Wenjunlia vitaminophila TaxID=76728 RepID=A0A0T6LSC2_WENVI|nr:ATP-binding protein [Wenjunlia vitaminophila]KRV48751.1 regulator [Wenjunlia vitaminophila]
MGSSRPVTPDDRGASGPGDTAAPLVAPVRRVLLAGCDGVVARARDVTREALYDWGWLPARTPQARARAEDALLVVSELVTNACLHAGGAQELRLRGRPGLLRLEVTDTSPAPPTPRTPHQGSRPGGHGMYIVQRLCSRWGTVHHPEGHGKTVWAEITGA